MPNIEVTTQVRGQGLFLSGTLSRSVDGGSSVEVTIPAAKTGVLTTRTDNETGSLTMDSGHGITTGAVIDLYWEGGARYEITVGTVSVNVVPIGADNSGNGSNLPAAATAITATRRTAIGDVVIGTTPSIVSALMQYATRGEAIASHVSMRDDSAEVEDFALEANVPRVWDVTGGDQNIFAGGNITNLAVSQASSTEDATFKMIWAQDVTP